VDGSYGFMADLRRLLGVYRRFERSLYLLNAAIIASLIYIAALLLGIPAFFKFYWQDSVFAAAPPVVSLVLGLFGGKILRRWSKSNFFDHLDENLSEKTKAAYDNRSSDSVVMQSLAEDVKRRLSKVGAIDMINNRRLNFGNRSVPIFQAKVGAVLLLFAFLMIFSQSQAGEDISPQPFKALTDLREKASDLFGEEELPDDGASSAGISGDIYGEPSLAVLEEVNLELVLYPGSAAGFRSKETEPMDRLFTTSEGGEGMAVPTDLYIESLPPQHREIIKKYFENLATDY
jgi:hypothetical protein